MKWQLSHPLIRTFALMKALAQKILSVGMALFLLASTTSWKVEKHFCMGHLIDMAFFVDAEDCGMSKDAMSEDMAENSCCSQDIVYVDGLDDLKASYDDLSVDQKTFLTVFTSSYFDLFFVPKERIIPLEQYPPPLLVKDIQLIDQVFLI